MKTRKKILQRLILNEHGLTLAELLIGVALLSMVMGVGYSFYSFSTNSFSIGQSSSSVRQNVRLSADFITQELRYATHVYLLNTIPNEGAFDTNLNYIYVKDGILKHRSPGGSEETVFSGISDGITLDQNLGFSLSGQLLAFKVKSNSSDGYSIDSKIKFINYPLVDFSGSTGIAIAYKCDRPTYITSYTVAWNGNNLEVTLNYSDDLMSDISNVLKSQFTFQNKSSNVSPDSIALVGTNSIKLTFNNYDSGGDKYITYNQSTNSMERLQDTNGAEVQSPNIFLITVPLRVNGYNAVWVGSTLEVTITYTGDLWPTIDNVARNQFGFQNNSNTILNPDAITRTDASSLKLSFYNYDCLSGGVKDLTYTQNINVSNRLLDSNKNYVYSPDKVTVSVPVFVKDFYSFIQNDNVFVYGNQFAFSGNQVNGPNATIVVQGNLTGSQLNGGSLNNVTNIYIDGYVDIDGGSAGLGSSTNPGSIYVDGYMNLLSGTRDIYGNVYVNGDFSLKDAKIHGNVYVKGNVKLDWTPTLDTNSRIYYTGSLSYPGSYPNSIISKCIKVSSVPSFDMPNYGVPTLKPDSWYATHGYVTGGNLVNGIKIFATNYSFNDYRTYSNVIIVSKGDITLNGWITVTGVLFAPNGKVTFGGASFTGLVIAKNGFNVTSGGSTVTFKNISNYISDPNDYPFNNNN